MPRAQAWQAADITGLIHPLPFHRQSMPDRGFGRNGESFAFLLLPDPGV